MSSMLRSVLARGFDRSRQSRDDLGRWERGVDLRCSQCAAVGISGSACHETGCPNIVKPCRECGSPDPDGTCCQPVDEA